jgi:SAM-dependent methyltransferase
VAQRGRSFPYHLAECKLRERDTVVEPEARPQLRAILEGEGDRYFERTRGHTLQEADPENDPPLRMIATYDLHPRNVLEVGAANGYRLASLVRLHGCRASGVEPGEAAVADGRSRFPNVRMEQGRADAIPYDDQFDLVIINFVFHWIDRTVLLKTVAEIDRVVEDGGFLLIGDFYPTHPTRARYHHLPGEDIYTYKQDWSAMFVASGSYRTVAMLSGKHTASRPTADVDDHDRMATWLLRKRLDGQYESAS